MKHTNRKYFAPVTAFGVAISLVTLVYIASAQTTSSSQHGSMQMMGTSAQQRAENPPGGCSMANGMTGERSVATSGCMMDGMMGNANGRMSCDMMSGMMDSADGHMSGGMMPSMMGDMMGQMMGNQSGQMMGGMMGQMMGNQSGQMMGDMHSDNPLIFSEALELRDEQIKQLRELQLSYAHSLVDAQAAIRKSELDVQATRTQPEDLRSLEQALRAAAEARIELELLQARQAEGISRVMTPGQREKWSNLRNRGGCNMAGGDGDISTGTDHAAHHPPPTP